MPEGHRKQLRVSSLLVRFLFLHRNKEEKMNNNKNNFIKKYIFKPFEPNPHQEFLIFA